MTVSIVRAAALALAVIGFAPEATADRTGGLPLPPGTRPAEGGTFTSSRSFRDTVSFYSRYLDRRSVPHRAIPVYRQRGVEVARFLAERNDSAWSAIHVYRHRGVTYIAIVGGPPLDLAE